MKLRQIENGKLFIFPTSNDFSRDFFLKKNPIIIRYFDNFKLSSKAYLDDQTRIIRIK